MLTRKQIKSIFYIGVGLTIFVSLFQNLLPFGTQERIDFYFTQMAFSTMCFSIALHYLLRNSISAFYMWYCISALINEIGFNGELNYVELITGFIALLYVIFCKK